VVQQQSSYQTDTQTIWIFFCMHVVVIFNPTKALFHNYFEPREFAQLCVLSKHNSQRLEYPPPDAQSPQHFHELPRQYKQKKKRQEKKEKGNSMIPARQYEQSPTPRRFCAETAANPAS
jgi:hypothetical protein